jgi:hypothetical protein
MNRFKCFPAILLLSTTLNGISQNTGEVSGYVTDSESGETLIGVTVRIESTDLGAVTDINGYYTIQNVPTETYSLKATYIGYKPEIKFNITVRSGGIPDVNFKLTQSTTQLEGVVIRPETFEKDKENPVSIQRLSAEEIATYPGGNNDIAKVVQSLPGVSPSIGGFRNDVIIRGGGPGENVYYLDGVEIPNINHFATQGSAGGPFGILNVSFFEGVTLSSSSFAAQYDNVLSGVIQFDQREGAKRNFRTNFRLSSSEAALTTEGPLFKGEKESGNTSFIASVRRSYLQLLFQVLELPFLPDYWDYQFKVNHKINDYNDLIFTGVGSIDNFSVNILDEFDPEQQAALEQTPIINQRTNTIGATWKKRFKKVPGYMTTTISSNYLQNKFVRYTDNVNEEGEVFSNDSEERETKLRYRLRRIISGYTFTTGFSFQRVDYSNQTVDRINNLSFDTDLSFNRYGLFAQVSKSYFEDRLGVSFGLRADGNTFTTNGNDVLSTLSPRLSASFALDEKRKWSINASTGRYFKIPPYTILGFQDNSGVFVNESADYIQTDHYVLGLEYLLNSESRISIEGFYKDYDNYPVSIRDSVSLANLGGDFEVVGNEPIASVGLGRTYGFEFLYQKKLSKRTYAILAYTYYRSEFTGFDEDNFLPSAWDSRNLISFTGGYQFGNNWELSGRFRFSGQTPFAEVDLEETNALNSYPILIFDYSDFGSARLDEFSQTDIRIDKKWNFPKWTFNVFVEVQNVLAQEIPQPPVFGLERTSNGELVETNKVVQISELENSTPLPSIGIVIDF